MAGADVVYGIRVIRFHLLDADGGIPAAPASWATTTDPQEATFTPVQVDGQRSELRGGDTLIAMIEEEDQILGFDIGFRNAKFDGTVMAKIHGGTYAGSVYTPPKLGDDRPDFYTEMYIAEYAEGAQHQDNEQGYIKLTLTYCKCSMPTFTAGDRQFIVPAFTIKARENVTDGLAAWKWEKVAALP